MIFPFDMFHFKKEVILGDDDINEMCLWKINDDGWWMINLVIMITNKRLELKLFFWEKKTLILIKLQFID